MSQFQVEFEILVAAVGNETVSRQSLLFRGQLSNSAYTKLVSVMLLISLTSYIEISLFSLIFSPKGSRFFFRQLPNGPMISIALIAL